MKNRTWRIIVVLILALVLGSSVGLYKKAKKIRGEGTERKLQRVSLRLNWTPDPTFAGAYIAKSRGYWRDQGLEVIIRPGAMHIDPRALIMDGTDTFGIVGANKLLWARGRDDKLVAISLEFRDNPVGWVVKKDSGIHGVKDFAGRVVGQKFGTEVESMLKAVLSVAKVNPESLKIVAVGYRFDPFTRGNVEVFPVYMNEEPHTIKKNAHIDCLIISPHMYDINPYGNVVIVSEHTIRTDPNMVQSFVSGLLEGWNAVLREETAEISAELVRIESDMALVPTEAVLLSTLELVRGDKSEPWDKVGLMSHDRWEETYALFHNHTGLGWVNVAAVYNNQFVEEYYGSRDK